METALGQDFALWTLFCKGLSWAKNTVWFWEGKPSLKGWELEKTPLDWKLNKPDMKTTEPQQTTPFIQHNFQTASPTLEATIHGTTIKLLADNACKGKKDLYCKSWSCPSFPSILMSFCYCFYYDKSSEPPAVHCCEQYASHLSRRVWCPLPPPHMQGKLCSSFYFKCKYSCEFMMKNSRYKELHTCHHLKQAL